MKKAFWVALILTVSLVLALFGAFFSSCFFKEASVSIAKDYFDPLESVLQQGPYAPVTTLNPYELGHGLSGLSGASFIYSSQAEALVSVENNYNFLPLCQASMVIAIKRHSDFTSNITGWQSLIDSRANLAFPHNGTESGRLAAIALAKGLNADTGDIEPALEILASLNAQARLNSRNVYTSHEYQYAYDPILVKNYDTIVMWDYQASVLIQEDPDNWEIVYPEEGQFTVLCGFLINCGTSSPEVDALMSFLDSDQGRKTIERAGFSPLNAGVNPDNMAGWEYARLAYNPRYRRQVLSIRRFAPASVLERLLVKIVALLLFTFVAQRIFRHIPRSQTRRANLHILSFIVFWLMLGIAKTLTLDSDLSRYLWFATYLPRHFVPVFWYFMCYSYRYAHLPDKKTMLRLVLPAGLLSAMVFTNDFHGQFFSYTFDNSATWIDFYTNNWGYYLSIAWSC